jgi:hypothetical protein
MVSFTPHPLYPQGKSPRYPLDRKVGGPQSRSGRGGDAKNFQSPPGIEPYNFDRPTRQKQSKSKKKKKNIKLSL